MFKDFAHRHLPCSVDGSQDLVIISRESKGSSQLGKESNYNGVFSPISEVTTGSLLQTTDDQYLVLSLRRTTDKDKYCGMVKVNAAIVIQRYSQPYDKNDNEDGPPTFTAVQTGVVAFAEFVSAKLLQEEPGLLPTTTHLLRVQNTVNVKRPNDPTLEQRDRILLHGRPYQVDDINDVKYPGLYQVQLSEDRR
ncbi:MAG: hypothetical protein K6T94_22490 [Paenibacillus sp.]|nr:hypothetical protein [Paenibacillus sp.]